MSDCLDKNREECKTTILYHLARKGTQNSFEKLKRFLPIMFQSYGILTLATQRQILLECGLQPVMDEKVYGVSFNLEQALLDRSSTVTRTSNPNMRPSTLEMDHAVYPGNPAHVSPLTRSPMLLLWLEMERGKSRPP